MVAVEPEPRLRTLAEQAAGTAPVHVEVIGGIAEQLPVGDASFDIVLTLAPLRLGGVVPKILRLLRRRH